MTATIVIKDKIDTLPFYDALTWEKFQALCTDVMYKKFDSIDSREYLSKGNEQQGIDVYAIIRGNAKLTVAQCKLVDYLTPKEVLDIIDEFLKGTMVGITQEFILCTSADLGRQRDEEKTIKEAEKKLAPHNIKLIIWDERGLSRELRTNPSEEIIHIVYRYFDEAVALAFYGDVWETYIQKLKQVPKRAYESPLHYIQRTVLPLSDQFSNTIIGQSLPDNNVLIQTLHQSAPKGNKILLLSIAGFGKSQELNNVAHYFSSGDKLIYPVKFILRDYSGQPIEDILSEYSPQWRNIKNENILLVLDGMDEIDQKYQQSFINHLNAFCELKKGISALVSCRFNFYDLSHPQLREFDVYILHPLSTTNIQDYIAKQLGDQRMAFMDIIAVQRFSDYASNPYYLTRLVNIYKNNTKDFPKNKTELFNRILFEKLEKDEGKYNIPELRNKLLPIAVKVAFCLTVSGKSSISDNELKLVVNSKEIKSELHYFGLLNKTGENAGAWSFEHKNVQEYLCATAFISLPFSKVQRIISFQFDRGRLIPRFLNTISFLFELCDTNTALFQQLFNWLNKNDPSLLVRFEKQQLSKYIRHEIFRAILEYHKREDVPVRLSQSFTYRELSEFTELDGPLIHFLGVELQSAGEAMRFDILCILSFCLTPWLFQEELKIALLPGLDRVEGPNYIIARTIMALGDVNVLEKEIVDHILSSEINLNDYEIRQSIIFYLSLSTFFEDYSRFLLKSVPVLEDHQRKGNSTGSYLSLTALLLRFERPQKIKEILQYCITDKKAVNRHSRHSDFHFEIKDLNNILVKATKAFETDTSILRVVYRLFCSMDNISIYEDWFAPFREFFRLTCGMNIIFQKFYRYDKKHRDIMSFASESNCDFLIVQYQSGALAVEDIIMLRNTLSHINQELFFYFNDKLELVDPVQFKINDLRLDYQQILSEQLERNQSMLLNKSMFDAEAEMIFSIIAKDNVSTDDLWLSESPDLRKYQSSLVLTCIRNLCYENEDRMITKEVFINHFNTKEKWDGFVIDTSVEILRTEDKDDTKKKLIQPLMQLVRNWVTNQIDQIDFWNNIKDEGVNFRYFPDIEFVKQVFLLSKPPLNDQQLLKILPSDHESFYAWTNEHVDSVGSVVSDEVQDKNLLRATVMSNIKSSKLAAAVLRSHYTLCNQLYYTECLSDLYMTITTNDLMTAYDKSILTDYYLNLGGRVEDFSKFLKRPEKCATEQEPEISWEWYLIEKLLFQEKDKISKILIDITNDSTENFNHLKATALLIKLSRIEGLEFWEQYIVRAKQIPFEFKWASMQEHIALMPPKKSRQIFLRLLEYTYNNKINDKFSRSHFTEDIIYTGLITVCCNHHKSYNPVKKKMESLIKQYANQPFSTSMKYYLLTLSKRFYESQSQETSISIANGLYEELFSVKKRLSISTMIKSMFKFARKIFTR